MSRNRVDWWNAHKTGEAAHTGALAWVKAQDSVQQQRRTKAYENAALMHVDVSNFGRTAPAAKGAEYFAFNKAHAGARAVASKVHSSPVALMAMTSGGTFAEQQKAKRFTAHIEDQFLELGVRDNDFAWCMDAMTWDAAVAKVFRDGDAVKVERRFAHQIIVDKDEAAMGLDGVRTMAEQVPVDRGVLLARFSDLGKEVREAIEIAPNMSIEESQTYGVDSLADLVLVTEIWHLSSGPVVEEDGETVAHDGRHAICIQNATLLDEEFDRERFPFVFMHQLPPQAGIWQTSFAERYANAQDAYDTLSQKLSECVTLSASLRLLQHADTTMEALDDQSGCYKWSGPQQPTQLQLAPLPPGAFDFLNFIGEGITRNEGIAEISATGNLPVGMRDAPGIAIEHMDELFSEQIAPMMRSRQAFWRGIGERILEEERAIAADNGGWTIMYADGAKIREDKFKDIDLGKGHYRLQVQTVGLMSKTPAAKYRLAAELRKSGDISRTAYLRMLDMPDAEAELGMETSDEDVVRMMIGDILENGKPHVAFVFDNPDTIIRLGKQAYNLGKIRGEKPEHLELLANYIMSAFDLKKQAAGPAPTMPAPPDAMPPPPPMEPGAPPGEPVDPAMQPPPMMGAPMPPGVA